MDPLLKLDASLDGTVLICFLYDSYLYRKSQQLQSVYSDSRLNVNCLEVFAVWAILLWVSTKRWLLTTPFCLKATYQNLLKFLPPLIISISFYNSIEIHNREKNDLLKMIVLM